MVWPCAGPSTPGRAPRPPAPRPGCGQPPSRRRPPARPPALGPARRAKNESSLHDVLHMVSHYNWLTWCMRCALSSRVPGRQAQVAAGSTPRHGLGRAQSQGPLVTHVVEADSMIERGYLTAHRRAGRGRRLEPSPAVKHREDYSLSRGESSSAARREWPQWCIGVGLAGEAGSVPG